MAWFHIWNKIVKCHPYNFTWIAYEIPFWKGQMTVPKSHAQSMLVALFHYKMHASDVMQFLRRGYTCKHRDINAVMECLVSHNINPWLITQYVYTTTATVGCPDHYSTEMSRENALLYWQEGNHPPN